MKSIVLIFASVVLLSLAGFWVWKSGVAESGTEQAGFQVICVSPGCEHPFVIPRDQARTCGIL